MTELFSGLGHWIGLMFAVFFVFLTFGVNFMPDWTKSPRFLVAAAALIVIGSTSFQ
jgi:hypothetical protein